MDFANIYCAFFAVFWLPTHLVKGHGFTDGELTWTAAVWIGGMVGNAIGGVISDASVARFGRAFGRRVVGVVGMLVVAVALMAQDRAHPLAAFSAASAPRGERLARRRDAVEAGRPQ